MQISVSCQLADSEDPGFSKYLINYLIVSNQVLVTFTTTPPQNA